MSYCRFSDDNYKCDVYAYEHVGGGFVIHVANNRYVGDIPQVDNSLLDSNIKEWSKQQAEQDKYLQSCGTQPIGLAHDGEMFVCDTLEDMQDTLLRLKGDGYHVPDYVFDEIKEEIESLQNNQP